MFRVHREVDFFWSVLSTDVQIHAIQQTFTTQKERPDSTVHLD